MVKADQKLKISIVGGGTSGWIAALMLEKWRSQQELPVEISVIESSEIGVIGTGEGATLILRMFMNYVEIDEVEFVKACNATIKLGIKFENWKQIGTSYLNPFCTKGNFKTNELGRIYDTNKLFAFAKGLPVHSFNPQAALMRLGRAPFSLDEKDNVLSLEALTGSQAEYSYHFDGVRVGKFLREIATKRGVTCKDGIVENVHLLENGNVARLELQDGNCIEADFFIDCSGFSSIVMNSVSEKNWKSYSDRLINNAAIPFFQPHSPDETLTPYTTACAEDHGWMWRIPTQARLGCGYVFNDQITDADVVVRELQKKVDLPDPRLIKFDTGRREHHWVKNVVALGLSSSFVEPLEATSIHATIMQCHFLINEMYPENGSISNPLFQRSFNSKVNRMLDAIVDYLAIHYISERRDTPYWQHIAELNLLTDTQRDLLETWKYRFPSDYDLPDIDRFVPFASVSYLYVLEGLGLLDPELASRELENYTTGQVKTDYSETSAFVLEYAGAALKHEEFIERCMRKKII